MQRMRVLKTTSKGLTRNEEQHRDEDDVNTKAWEITVTAEMKRKMAGPWQTSDILKLMGKQLGYRALQSRLAGIWRPTGNMQFIDIGYGFYIMKFEALKDYHHALRDGPWFVGDQYLHVQAWEADFHPCTAKVTTTAVWIQLEQLPIEYYHPDFFKHVGIKLGKLLKIDAVTSSAIRGHFAQLCVQIDINKPLAKRIKIGTFCRFSKKEKMVHFGKILYMKMYLFYAIDWPNKRHCPDKPIRYYCPPKLSMDDGREAIKRAFNIPNCYKLARRPLGGPSKSTLSEPKSITKEVLMPP